MVVGVAAVPRAAARVGARAAAGGMTEDAAMTGAMTGAAIGTTGAVAKAGRPGVGASARMNSAARADPAWFRSRDDARIRPSPTT